MKIAIISLYVGLAAAGLAAAAPAGKILILDNELLIEGDIRIEGEQYHIRKGMGETIIPAARVIEVVADRKQAYQVMRERCNRRDFDDRLHLVRWCMENSLRAEALAEAELLQQFRPGDTQLRSLVQGLRTLQASAPAPASPASAKPAEKVIEVEPLDYNREAFGLFVSRVQPILMNACAACHVGDHGGKFNLIRVTEGSNRKAAMLNLAATLKQIKRDELDASPLLLKAVAAHGKATHPPLRDRQSPAYQHLEAWVRMAVPETPSPAAPVQVVKPIMEEKKPAPKTAFGETSTTQPKPEPQTEAKDPFDPAIFNGTIQPKKD